MLHICIFAAVSWFGGQHLSCLLTAFSVVCGQFVDDGVCDCCDGSDENGTITCPDTCLEEGRSKMAALELSLAEAEAGLKKKEALRKQAKTKRAEWEIRLEHLEETESRAAQVHSLLLVVVCAVLNIHVV